MFSHIKNIIFLAEILIFKIQNFPSKFQYRKYTIVTLPIWLLHSDPYTYIFRFFSIVFSLLLHILLPILYLHQIKQNWHVWFMANLIGLPIGKWFFWHKLHVCVYMTIYLYNFTNQTNMYDKDTYIKVIVFLIHFNWVN